MYICVHGVSHTYRYMHTLYEKTVISAGNRNVDVICNIMNAGIICLGEHKQPQKVSAKSETQMQSGFLVSQGRTFPAIWLFYIEKVTRETTGVLILFILGIILLQSYPSFSTFIIILNVCLFGKKRQLQNLCIFLCSFRNHHQHEMYL